MANVRIGALHKSYGSVHAVRGIDLDIPDGEFTVLVGPSGCGKSTLLRTIAGLEDADAGEIEIGGEIVNHMRPRDRDVAMVFQDYALYPHMTVFGNISLSLRARRMPKQEIEERVKRVAGMLGVRPLLERYPRQLSGGQRQRVAIGRAMVRNPRVFLFDEPLSNLDAQLRDEMRGEIKRLHQEVATTMIYVTHDQVEAMTLADRIVLFARRRDRAAGRAARSLRAALEFVRRRIPRVAKDELRQGHTRAHYSWRGGEARRRRAFSCPAARARFSSRRRRRRDPRIQA
jgi:multiple sugar transport system ATP-binding protein